MRRRRPRVPRTDVTRALVAAALVAAATSATAPRATAATSPTACPASAPLAEPPVVTPRTSGGSTVTETLVDRTRGTEAAKGAPALDCRVLPVDVLLPDSPGPHPLIVTVHGRDGDPASLRPLLDTWVDAGYAVAAPTFPITRKDDDDKPLAEDVAEQAHDVSFVISRLVEQSQDPASPLRGAIDSTHIGAVGMSLGGLTVYGLVANTCCRDRRIDAAIEMAGVYRAFPRGHWVSQQVPILLLHGDADKGYHNSVAAYPRLGAPKWFITLRGSLHSPPFETPRGPEAPLVDATTTLFWNRYLRGDVPAAHGIVAAVSAARDEAKLARHLSP
jgi:dienelactone hydrolase